jgi:LDH2 family malate/lactate/ureidoglycolate dehydrogenase
MLSVKQVRYISVRKLYRFIEDVFIHLHIPSNDAKISANILLEAELRGFGCHGIARLLHYVERLQNGLIESHPQVSIKWLSETTGFCDGGNGLGMVVSYNAMKNCIDKAKKTSSAFLTVNNSNHFSIAGYYSSMAIEHDMIGIAMTNASPRVVPTGGTTGKLGTNPISIAIPRQKGNPFILDMSTSVVSSGRIDNQLRKNEKIPEGWTYPSSTPFLDDEGVAPMSVLQLPLGGNKLTSGYKGYGLGLMVDILCGVLSGANFGTDLKSSKMSDQRANIGHFFGAIKISGFTDKDRFYDDIEKLIVDIKDSPLEKETDKILIAGEREAEMKKYYRKNGIPVLKPVLEKMNEICDKLKINKDY